jgi:hypothetical protein
MGYSFPTRVSIGAAATVPNGLAGTAIEYIGDDVMLDIYGNGEISGMTFALTGFQGSNPGMQFIPTGSSLGVASTPGRVKANEDFIASVPIPANTRLVLPVTNPGAASNFDFLFVIH